MGAIVLTSEHITGGRGILRWSRTDLAKASGVSPATIKRIEQEPGQVMANRPTIVALCSALESAGVELTDGPGVRLAAKP